MGKVTKRDGTVVPFDKSKIVIALQNANDDVAPEYQISEKRAHDIADRICNQFQGKSPSVEAIQDSVELELMKMRYFNLAKEYMLFRYRHELMRKSNTTDESILSLVRNENKDLSEENSNKNATLASTERDYFAGEVSKDLTRRILLPRHIVKAHDEGQIHFHDMDYFLQSIFNCCLINIRDVLNNGTVMNGKMIERPKSFRVACTVMTQVIATVASNQYGGQSVNIKHLGPFVDISRQKIKKQVLNDLTELGVDLKGREFSVDDIVEKRLREEIAAGVQTIQYQINTLMTTNGQSPFVTLFMELDETDPYIDDVALVIEEMLTQRLEGIKNEKGAYSTPAFPKLVYVLDEHNCLKGGRFDYLTRLAVKCSAKRMYPDYISAKKMRETYGDVFSCMGCRSFLSPWKDENGELKWEGRFNQGVVSINLPQIGIIAKGDEEKFWSLLEKRLALCFEALMCRHHALEGTLSDVSPIHWQFGAIARLEKGETIDRLLHGGYSTLSLGYIGLYEVTKLMTGESHTSPRGKQFALKVMARLKDACDSWKASTGLGFSLYGTPAESLCYRFAKVDYEKFGSIEDVTDKGYYTNSYHVDVREHINAFDKLTLESEFQDISTGGAVSYVEIPNMEHNLEALEALVKFIYENIRYAEFNTKSDYCLECGYSGEIPLNKDLVWECPQCHNTKKSMLDITRRTCGYLGENFWNTGKTKELNSRVLHL